ncbi:MAG: hypothetical protein ACI4MM_07530, partial [Candidatus Ventricola sp.]
MGISPTLSIQTARRSTLQKQILCGYYITAFSKIQPSIRVLSAIPAKFSRISFKNRPIPGRRQKENSVVWLVSGR